jgi:P-type conjugative transfer protein TrbJ
MMKKHAHLTRTAVSSALALALVVLPAAASAQMPVIDSTNYAQNLLQAARALEQINNQVKSLQNEATMLGNMARNLKTFDFPELQKITSALKKIDDLMNQAQAIGFKAGEVDASFDAMFPGSAGQLLTTDQRVAQASKRFSSAMESFRHAMNVQAEVVSNIQSDSALLNDLASRSQSSAGALQVQQAANQLMALSAKQQMQLQDLLAAEFRSQTIDRATRAQAEAEARAATSRFLGSGKAYSGTRE